VVTDEDGGAFDPVEHEAGRPVHAGQLVLLSGGHQRHLVEGRGPVTPVGDAHLEVLVPGLVADAAPLGQGDLHAAGEPLAGALQYRAGRAGGEQDGVVQGTRAVPAGRAQRGHRRVVPAAVHGAQAAQVEEHRQRAEALDPLRVGGGAVADRGDERGVLRAVLRALRGRAAVRAQPLTGIARIVGRVADRVELVVAHHTPRVPRLDHAPDDLEHAQLVAATVDQVAEEQRLPPLRRPIAAARAHVAHRREQGFELAGLAVEVTDHVVAVHVATGVVFSHPASPSSHTACIVRFITQLTMQRL